MCSGRTKVDSTIIVWRVHGRIQSPSLVSNNYKYDSSVGWPVHSLQSLYYTYPFSCVNSCLRNWHASLQMCSMYSAIMTVTWRGGCRLLWPFELYKRFKQSALKRTFPDGWLTRKRFYKAVISQHRRKGKNRCTQKRSKASVVNRFHIHKKCDHWPYDPHSNGIGSGVRALSPSESRLLAAMKQVLSAQQVWPRLLSHLCVCVPRTVTAGD